MNKLIILLAISSTTFVMAASYDSQQKNTYDQDQPAITQPQPYQQNQKQANWDPNNESKQNRQDSYDKQKSDFRQNRPADYDGRQTRDNDSIDDQQKSKPRYEINIQQEDSKKNSSSHNTDRFDQNRDNRDGYYEGHSQDQQK